MKFRASTRVLSLAFLAILLLTAAPSWAAPSDAGIDRWPTFRGPAAHGQSTDGVLPDDTFGLVVDWSIDLGSGYSHMTVADGKAITMYAAEDKDWLGAFDTETGALQWRYELGDMYVGHDGSDDGPVGTPTIAGDAVYALGPRGALVAVSLADGSELWRHELDETNASVPHYGFTTGPIVHGDLLIVATGGDGHAVTAYDRATGAQTWAKGDGTVQYQTPSMVTLAGRQQLLVPTDQALLGVDPNTGDTLWSFSVEGRGRPEGSAHVTVVDGDRFVLKLNAGSKLLRATADGVEEVWNSRAFGNTFALPVLHDGHLYGFTGNILSAVDVETGDFAWRAREAASRGLTLVDGHLAILTLDGHLVLAEANPSGYVEVARVAAFEIGDYAIPAYANGRFFLRNLSKMAAVRVDQDAKPKVADAGEDRQLLGDFGAWVETVEAMPESERPAAVANRFAYVDTTPLHEGDDGLVHIVYRGDVEDVGIVGDFTGQQEHGLHRVAGTGLFFRSYELDPKAQYTYAMSLDYGPAGPDPSNPYTVDQGFNTVSELRMPQWPASPHLEPVAEGAPQGRLDTFQFHSEALDNTREIQVYLPAGYDQGEQRYPVLVVNHGDNLLRGGLMKNTLDNLLGKTVEPLIAVFVPRAQGPEYGGPQADGYNQFLKDELLPHVDRHYRTDGARRAIMGPGSAGVAAVYAAFAMPDVFPKAAAQSYYMIDPVWSSMPDVIAAAETKPEIYLVLSTHDYTINPEITADTITKQLVEHLEAAGVDHHLQMATYSPGWGGWRGQHDEVLEALFPAPDAN